MIVFFWDCLRQIGLLTDALQRDIYVHERTGARGPRGTELHNSGCVADLGYYM